MNPLKKKLIPLCLMASLSVSTYSFGASEAVSVFAVGNFVNQPFSLALNGHCTTSTLGVIPANSFFKFFFTPRDLEPYCTHTLPGCSMDVHPSIDCSGVPVATIQLGVAGIQSIQNHGSPGYAVSFQGEDNIQDILIGSSNASS